MRNPREAVNDRRSARSQNDRRVTGQLIVGRPMLGPNFGLRNNREIGGDLRVVFISRSRQRGFAGSRVVNGYSGQGQSEVSPGTRLIGLLLMASEGNREPSPASALSLNTYRSGRSSYSDGRFTREGAEGVPRRLVQY